MLPRILMFGLSVILCSFHCCAAQQLTSPESGFSKQFNSAVLPADIGSQIGKPIRPRPAPFKLSSEWVTDSEAGLVTSQANATLPLLFLNSPPPLVNVGFGHTDLFAAEEFGLPDELFEYTIGVSWFRKINEVWSIRTMLGIGFATDHLNTSSDSWQFRGGVFGIYKQSENLSWTFGALATGRDDLPVIPAVGAVWMPNSHTRWDLTFPKPRVNFLLVDEGDRQQWLYFGAGINGNTWGIELPNSGDDRLTYKDVRMVLGWESRPSFSARTPFAIGKTLQVEIGYVFAREFEFEEETRIEELENSFMAGLSTKF